MALLRGLYDAQPGTEIKVDGQNTKAASIHETVTLFPQEPEIFENTIEHNITLGLPFEKQEIMGVCDSAHFSEVLSHLPKGLESNIMEKGVNLSGGQKQRLALARGILAAKSSDIILLDEPTSSVDPKTELRIYERLFEEYKNKAVISSLHRLYLLSYFDYVYVLQAGRVVAEGSFEYLKNTSAVFRELWKHQEDKRES
jgi:ATP-binding cassette, subfamily B, bacterial